MLIQTLLGDLSILTSLRTGWLHSLRAGLWSGAFEPRHDSTIGELGPASFSGYSGLRDMITWNTPVITGSRAVMQHGELLWHHDGGPDVDMVAGYYVVDTDGTLVWAEVRSAGPVLMQSATDVYRLVPAYTIRSEF